ncbi:cache domain-containing protein [Geoalkalibacter halelectricus]|uniref:histidine kinase n=1 Tax=Geoalkalibacter halelectricus TaxID=2847045 RepID=A0ABY5ZH65_9BACT|nr:cache domain-containing protein [Geoalkalibacter halelectricus]MDO3377901.1 cache domain-containing protein [Geoalkalibacter halelectricus]UWZ77918.1 cache domain-containing protein [Geoalkalibacter halelectricus]
MRGLIFNFVVNLKLRWKMLVVVLPLVVLPIFVVGGVIGYISYQQAYRGITKASKDDLDHMARFTLDLLDAHHKQFQVYKEDKRQAVRNELRTLADLAYSLAESHHAQYLSGEVSLNRARSEAARALKQVSIGQSGYIFAMTSQGQLTAHPAREGDNIYDEQDQAGRYFIRAMSRAALRAPPGQVLFIVYPWRNELLGDQTPRQKLAAYRYFPEWDWIIAATGYLEETYEDLAFERRSFADLKQKIQSKRVGRTGYIYCMDTRGTLHIHPEDEGLNIAERTDFTGNFFVREMTENKNGWIRYPWRGANDSLPRMKIVRYLYFKPWDWIVAVGSYEDEFFEEAKLIKTRILGSLFILTFFVGATAVLLVFVAAQVLTNPIHHMIEVIRQVRRGRLDAKMQVESQDELGELAAAFNRMTEIMKRNQEMEASLSQQGKMASLGVLSSGVAHEINNPLGVILGYAAYLEGKLDPDDPKFKYVHEIKRESKRCKKIVQDLLNYARTPKPALEETDLNQLLEQIVDFAANHTDMHQVRVRKAFAPDLPRVMVDGDQIRQVAINLILNAGAAMPEGGDLVVGTCLSADGFVELSFADTGSGIPPEYLEKIFEPFFTTRPRGTGLGLAITRQIIELHQGEIHIDSEPGRGTRVLVRLPALAQEGYDL